MAKPQQASEQVSQISPKVSLPLSAVAVSGKTGSGKSSIFFGSHYVLGVVIADPGSLGHILYQRKDLGAESIIISPTDSVSPIRKTLEAVQRWTQSGRLCVVDSFSALQEQQCAWFKMNRKKDSLTIKDHQQIVGDLRDLALALSALPCFVIFNTAPGGVVKSPEGQNFEYPKGALVGYPSLSGIGANSESVLSRFTTSWVIFPGWIRQDKDGNIVRNVPRGFLLPWRDLRTGDAGQYTPIKDPLQVIEETKTLDPARGDEVHAFLPMGQCTIDSLLDKIAKKFGPKQPAEAHG